MSFEDELHNRRLRGYDDQLVDMAADPLNGAAKDMIEMPPAIRRRLVQLHKLQFSPGHSD
jgi:hypothetical protein